MTSIVQISEFSDTWADEFEQVRGFIAQALSDLALRIDHIGSTSVPGMDAKDVIDVQVTVDSLAAEDQITQRFESIGFVRRPYHQDHKPPAWRGDDADWQKLVFAPPETVRTCNVHVREAGRANQRFALLFRDYMRSHPDAVTTWVAMKRCLAKMYPDDLLSYGVVKDAATEVLMLAAEEWAVRERWTPERCG